MSITRIPKPEPVRVRSFLPKTGREISHKSDESIEKITYTETSYGLVYCDVMYRHKLVKRYFEISQVAFI